MLIMVDSEESMSIAPGWDQVGNVGHGGSHEQSSRPSECCRR